MRIGLYKFNWIEQIVVGVTLGKEGEQIDTLV